MIIRDQALPYFFDLQRRSFDIFLYVACHENNFNTYSIKIESLFVDVCSFFDSICQTYIGELKSKGHTFGLEDSVKDFSSKVAKLKFFDAGDYRLLFEGDFKLSDKEVGVNAYETKLVLNSYPLVPEKQDSYIILPFAEWAHGKSPAWWQAFTKLKHNRLANHQEATLKNLVYALAGTYLIILGREYPAFYLGGIREIYELFLPWDWVIGYDIAAKRMA